jgi:hypothetical protein
MSLDYKVQTVSLGGKVYLDRDSLLDFLGARARLTVEELRRRGTPLADTEYLRGQSFEQQVITDAIQSPT